MTGAMTGMSLSSPCVVAYFQFIVCPTSPPLPHHKQQQAQKTDWLLTKNSLRPTVVIIDLVQITKSFLKYMWVARTNHLTWGLSSSDETKAFSPMRSSKM